ncbi:hypothetical protein PoB_000619100 [Plakobranchus ocellatus]|uniref:Uncharacterized protein n=1 Tax=Plakobranchus ocellatus TaxID=259542 RepID=A0AAV3XXK5_9GAST|nr:hypothetical protein PoB_000619100 [Plakobranchus ocellatus]
MRCACLKSHSDTEQDRASTPASNEPRYPGDYIDWSKPWPKYRRLETTEAGVDFWDNVRRVVDIEFVRKNYLCRGSDLCRQSKHVKWSASIERAFWRADRLALSQADAQVTPEPGAKARPAAKTDSTRARQRVPPAHLPKSFAWESEVEYYKADRRAWEQGQRLIANEQEISDDN